MNAFHPPVVPPRRLLACASLLTALVCGCLGDLDIEAFAMGQEQDAGMDGGEDGGGKRDDGDAREDGDAGAKGDDERDAGDEVPAEDGGKDAGGSDERVQDAGSMDDVKVAASPLPTDAWSASASASNEPVENAFDGDLATRWSNGALMVGGEWFQLDLGAEETFTRVVLDATGSDLDFPVGYRLYVSSDASDFGDPIAEGDDAATVTTISFEPRTARYLRIEQTGQNDEAWWSIHELIVEGYRGS